MLAGRVLALPKNPCVLCRLPLLAVRLLCMCLRQPVSMRCLGSQPWKYRRMLCLGQLRSRFYLQEIHRSIFLCRPLRMRCELSLKSKLLQQKRRRREILRFSTFYLSLKRLKCCHEMWRICTLAGSGDKPPITHSWVTRALLNVKF